MDEPLDPALAAVIAAIPEWEGDEPDVTPITIGITNRNFKVDIGGDSFVVRLSGKDTDLLGIDRAAEYEAASAAAAAGVAPEVFAFLPDLGALITRFVHGAHIPEDDLEREDVLGAVVRSVRPLAARSDDRTGASLCRSDQECNTASVGHPAARSHGCHTQCEDTVDKEG